MLSWCSASRVTARGRPPCVGSPCAVQRSISALSRTVVPEGRARRSWLVAGLACDIADTAAAFLGRRGGYLSTPVSALLAAPALAAVGMGIIALRGGEQTG